MKIIWSEFASEMLKETYLYHKEVAGIRIAKKLNPIFSAQRNSLNSIQTQDKSNRH